MCRLLTLTHVGLFDSALRRQQDIYSTCEQSIGAGSEKNLDDKFDLKPEGVYNKQMCLYLSNCCCVALHALSYLVQRQCTSEDWGPWIWIATVLLTSCKHGADE
jgi:hypothetical protein